MIHICEDCWDHFDGELDEVPHRVMPTVPVYCGRCMQVHTGGYDVFDYPRMPWETPIEGPAALVPQE